MNRDQEYDRGSQAEAWRRRIDVGLNALTKGASVSVVRPPQSAWDSKQPRLVLAGSFDPLHRGHVAMAQYAGGRFAGPVWYELALQNADKGQLAASEVHRRLLPHLLTAEPDSNRSANEGLNDCVAKPRFAPHGLLISRLPTFLDKASALPDTDFLVGIDTWQRIVDDKYYADRDRNTALGKIVDAGCRFVVFGRLVGDAFLDPASDLGLASLPSRVASAVIPVSGSHFRVDVSSTQLRESD